MLKVSVKRLSSCCYATAGASLPITAEIRGNDCFLTKWAGSDSASQKQCNLIQTHRLKDEALRSLSLPQHNRLMAKRHDLARECSQNLANTRMTDSSKKHIETDQK